MHECASLAHANILQGQCLSLFVLSEPLFILAKLDRERRQKAQLEKQQQLKEQLVSLERKPTLAEKVKGSVEKRLRMCGYGGSQRDLGSLKPGSQYYKQRKALIRRTLFQQLRADSSPTTVCMPSWYYKAATQASFR